MGGQICAQCHTCRQSEWSLATYLGREETNAVFKKRGYHISTYFRLLYNLISWRRQTGSRG
jgi:hypothetical protein